MKALVATSHQPSTLGGGGGEVLCLGSPGPLGGGGEGEGGEGVFSSQTPGHNNLYM
jgi:hypothetical protein